MEREITEEKNQAKKEMILSFTKFAITGDEKENNDVLLNTILCSFLEAAKSKDDLTDRYESFRSLDQIIQDSYLFDMVISIASKLQKDEEEIRRALSTYGDLVNNKDYRNLTVRAGYRVSSEFGVKTNYYTDRLKKRVEFYYDFRDKFFESYNKIQKEGVSRK